MAAHCDMVSASCEKTKGEFEAVGAKTQFERGMSSDMNNSAKFEAVCRRLINRILSPTEDVLDNEADKVVAKKRYVNSIRFVFKLNRPVLFSDPEINALLEVDTNFGRELIPIWGENSEHLISEFLVPRDVKFFKKLFNDLGKLEIPISFRYISNITINILHSVNPKKKVMVSSAYYLPDILLFSNILKESLKVTTSICLCFFDEAAMYKIFSDIIDLNRTLEFRLERPEKLVPYINPGIDSAPTLYELPPNLTRLTSLTSLNLLGYEINEQTMIRVAELLRTNQSLRELKLCLAEREDNSEAANKFAVALRVNKTLTSLTFSFHQFIEEEIETIRDALVHNKSLTEFANNYSGEPVVNLNQFRHVIPEDAINADIHRLVTANKQQRSLWGSIAVLTAFMRANKDHVFQCSVMPLLEPISEASFRTNEGPGQIYLDSSKTAVKKLQVNNKKELCFSRFANSKFVKAHMADKLVKSKHGANGAIASVTAADPITFSYKSLIALATGAAVIGIWAYKWTNQKSSPFK